MHAQQIMMIGVSSKQHHKTDVSITVWIITGGLQFGHWQFISQEWVALIVLHSGQVWPVLCPQYQFILPFVWLLYTETI